MRATVKLDRELRFNGKSDSGHESYFDTSHAGGGLDSAPSPVETVLEAVGACSGMDVVSIVKKMRKQVDSLTIGLLGERRDEHPKIFTKVHITYELMSPNATIQDLRRAIKLSHDKYCTVSAIVRLSGCEISWDATILNSTDGTRVTASSQESGSIKNTAEI